MSGKSDQPVGPTIKAAFVELLKKTFPTVESLLRSDVVEIKAFDKVLTIKSRDGDGVEHIVVVVNDGNNLRITWCVYGYNILLDGEEREHVCRRFSDKNPVGAYAIDAFIEQLL